MIVLKSLVLGLLLVLAACADPGPNEWRGETHFNWSSG